MDILPPNISLDAVSRRAEVLDTIAAVLPIDQLSMPDEISPEVPK